MKKKLVAILLILFFGLIFVACEIESDESIHDLSKAENISEQESKSDFSDIDISENNSSFSPEVSETSESEISNNETSTGERYVWYGQEELDEWYKEYLDAYEEAPTGDGKHYYFFYEIGGPFFELIAPNQEFVDEYVTKFDLTEDFNIAAACEYYGITKEEYMKVALETNYDNVFGAEYGEKPIILILNFTLYQFDVWFSEEYWNHDDLVLDSYVSPEYDSYYTSVKDGVHTRRYFIIDYRLIEYVGVDDFEEWIAGIPDEQQNIIEFVKHFGITRSIYNEIYSGIEFLPYNPDYLFGTPEMQEEYFTVHPLN